VKARDISAVYCWFIFIMSVLTFYIINKNYQWILTFGLQKYLLPSQLCFFFFFIHVHVCYKLIFFNINQQYVHVKVWYCIRCVILLFYVLMIHIILYAWIQWCNKTTQILLTPPYPHVISDHWFGNTFSFCTHILFAVHFNCTEKNLTFMWRT
jgi:hypothetical protein